MPDYQSAYRRLIKAEQGFLVYGDNHHHGHGQKRYQKLATATAMIARGIEPKRGPVVDHTLIVDVSLERILERIQISKVTFRKAYLPSILREAHLDSYRIRFIQQR